MSAPPVFSDSEAEEGSYVSEAPPLSAGWGLALLVVALLMVVLAAVAVLVVKP